MCIDHAMVEPFARARRVARWLVRALALCLLPGLLLTGWLTGAMDGPQNALNNPELPFYTQKNLRPRWDRWASMQQVASFTLQNQREQAVDASLFRRKPTFVGFFYAGCVTLCPISLEVLQQLQAKIGKASGTASTISTAAAAAAGRASGQTMPQFVLLTITPEFDDAKTLAAYAKRLKLPADWMLLTGKPQQVLRLADSLNTDISARDANGEPLHGQRAFLLDTQGRVRGIYDATSMTEMLRMQNDWQRLANTDEQQKAAGTQ
jgi:cytochrome oxidase Cu insertion factor (SCO1/SenC/PrrC family)